MRVIICDFCGMRQIIPGDDNTCKVPNGWLDLYVAETVKEDRVVNLCKLCKEAYDKRYSLARSVLSDTMSTWIKGHLIDVKTMMENEANRIYARAWNACNAYWLDTITNAPTVPERPRGEWKETGYETGALGITYRQTQCSNCGWEHALPMRWHFCPNCGADMRKGGEE